jgi:hypothetical protein
LPEAFDSRLKVQKEIAEANSAAPATTGHIDIHGPFTDQSTAPPEGDLIFSMTKGTAIANPMIVATTTISAAKPAKKLLK